MNLSLPKVFLGEHEKQTDTQLISKLPSLPFPSCSKMEAGGLEWAGGLRNLCWLE